MLLEERERPGFLCFRNSYWKVSLFSIRGRAVPWLPLLIYMTYTCGVVLFYTYILRQKLGLDLDKLKQLSSVTTTIGVALFLLLSFRNNAAFQRWQTGADRFKNFCHIGKNISRLLANTLSSYVAVGGEEVAYDLVLEKLNWVMAALECGRQHLRGEKHEDVLLEMMPRDQVLTLHNDSDPVLYCIYKLLDMDRKYFVQKCNEWMRSADMMYMEFCACTNVLSTPIPFAYISHLRTFLVLWMACVPWVYVMYYDWYTVMICLVIGYGIIGVEEAAVEVEQPFGRDFNDIPLDTIVADTYSAISTYIRIVLDAKVAAGQQSPDDDIHNKDQATGGGGANRQNNDEEELAAGAAAAGGAAAGGGGGDDADAGDDMA